MRPRPRYSRCTVRLTCFNRALRSYLGAQAALQCKDDAQLSADSLLILLFFSFKSWR